MRCVDTSLVMLARPSARAVAKGAARLPGGDPIRPTLTGVPEPAGQTGRIRLVEGLDGGYRRHPAVKSTLATVGQYERHGGAMPAAVSV